jgi:hypothetical protein
MKLNTNIVFYSILAFHIVWCGYSFYTMFSDYSGWTIYHWRPFLLLLFTLVWAGVCSKKYLFGFAYIGIVMIEFLTKAAYREATWADVFGEVLFPIDLIFVAVLLFLFKTHFGILQRPNSISIKRKRDA